MPGRNNVRAMVSADDVLDAEALLPTSPSRAERVLEFTRAHAHALVIVLVVVLGFTAFRLMGASGHDVPTPTPSVSTPSSAPSPTEAQYITVHVLGAVASPGVIRIEEGSRVVDVLEAAGGLLPSGDVGELNLAARVPDGAQVIVGTVDEPRGEIRSGTSPGDSSTGESGVSSTSKVNLNTATAAELENLPGVGPVMAGRIVAWRQEHGRFSQVQELKEVDGVGAKTYDRLAPLVEV